jgi:hypothetical protein
MMNTNAEGALGDQDVHVGGRDFRLHDVPIFFTAEITGIQHLHSIYFYYKHSGTYDVSSNIGCDFDAFFFLFNPKCNFIDAFNRLINMLS